MLPKESINSVIESTAKSMKEVFSGSELDDMARRCRLIQRKRKVTPLELAVSCISTLGAGKANWIADVLRTYNAFTGKNVQYKPFHNQLVKDGFPEFMRLMLERVLSELTVSVLECTPSAKIAMFEDVLLHDGTSFRLKDSLKNVFPGRFKKGSPAAIELHVTMSALEDNPVRISLAPDKEAERQFSPKPCELRNKLLLEDCGYQDRRIFKEIQEAGGYFVVRGTDAIRPTIAKAYVKGRRVRGLEDKKLTARRLPRATVDMDIEWTFLPMSTKVYRGRLIAIYKPGKRNEKRYVYLHTNLNRAKFSAVEIGELYRLRWQIELLFKEWKSFNNLHRFDTSKQNIAEGLVWASLLAATLKRVIAHAAEQSERVELSTQRVASSAPHFFDDLLRAIVNAPRSLVRVLRETFFFLSKNAQRAHPARDASKGRLRMGFRPVAVASIGA